MQSSTVITLLSQSDPVVLQEDDLKAISHHGVVVNDVADGRDELDDHLSGVVPRSCLQAQTQQEGLRVRSEEHTELKLITSCLWVNASDQQIHLCL